MPKTLYDPADLPTPEKMAEDRGPLSSSVMTVPGDPVIDMAQSLRNIEWMLREMYGGMSILLHRGASEANNGEHADPPLDGSKKRSSQSTA